MSRDLWSKFWATVEFGDCWHWVGPKNRKGYGIFHLPGNTSRAAHRFAWFSLIGELSREVQLDHLCKNHECVNPDHLEPVTGQENKRRGWRARKTFCLRGHEFTPENTRRDRDGHRNCRACSAFYRERYLKRWRQRLDAGEIAHGTNAAYWAGCRCDECRRAESEKKKRLYAAKKAMTADA